MSWLARLDYELQKIMLPRPVIAFSEAVQWALDTEDDINAYLAGERDYDYFNIAIPEDDDEAAIMILYAEYRLMMTYTALDVFCKMTGHTVTQNARRDLGVAMSTINRMKTWDDLAHCFQPL